MSLMERINKALGKDKEPINDILRGGNATSNFGKPEDIETESDNDSDFDDNVSLYECAKMAMEKSSEEAKTSVHSCRINIPSKTSSKHSTSIDISSDDDSKSQAVSGSSKEKITRISHSNLIPTRTSVSTHDIDKSVNFPALSSYKYRRTSTDGQPKEKPSDDLLSTNSVEEDLPPLSFSQQVDVGKTESKTKNKAEKEAIREQKRKAKETEKLAKLQEKQRKLEEKESKKKLAEMEKASKKAESMTLKAESLDQCLKYITTVLDSNILNDGGGSILQALDTLGVQYEIKQLPVEATVGWMRDHVEFKVEENCQVKRVSNYQEENTILMRLKAEDFARMIQAQNEQASSSHSSCVETIFDRLNNVDSLLPDKKLSILVTGLNSYMKTMKAKAGAKRNPLPQISKIDIEEVLLRLQLQFSCCVHFCETAEDLAQMVASFTKSVAEKPYKKIAGTAFNIYMNNHDKGLSRVTKDGQGLLEVWSKQIQQFRGVGHDTAAAIVQRYPSPFMLMQEYEKCRTEQEGKLLLQDIEVRRGHGVLATSRRVGPELSKKIYQLLNSLDGDVELAKS